MLCVEQSTTSNDWTKEDKRIWYISGASRLLSSKESSCGKTGAEPQSMKPDIGARGKVMSGLVSTYIPLAMMDWTLGVAFVKNEMKNSVSRKSKANNPSSKTDSIGNSWSERDTCGQILDGQMP